MHHAPDIHNEQKLQAIDHLYQLFQAWQDTKTTPYPEPHTFPKVTRPDVTRLPQDTNVNKTSRPQQNQESPRVTPTAHNPPRNVDIAQYNFNSPKGPRHPSPAVSAPIAKRTRYQTEYRPI